ncbi:MAG: pitrilysin family protein [Proteobacteria bacterium]|nr:pitrilysin family protein [Pseudomonadota bacterium]
MMHKYIAVGLCLWAAAFSIYAQDTPPATHEYRLSNGLKLIVREDHRAPVVVSQVWYKVGSSYEDSGTTGISHVLEHMMFKGTRKHGPNEFSRIIAQNGGRENAFTGRDYTAYFQQLEKGRLAVSFELEADRMRNLRLKQEEFAKEVRVVMEERRMRTDDDPEALTAEQFTAVAFHNNPYRIPVIGWMGDLENLRVTDLQAWYKTWYAPNNATLVVVGDVQPDAVFKLAGKYFGALKPAPLPTLKPHIEAEQMGTRRITVKAPAELPYLLMGYPAPVLKSSSASDSWEPYALEMLSALLSGGDSARLARHLVRGQKIAANASAGYNLTARLPDMFMIDGTPAQGRTIDELEQALRGEIKRLQDEPVSEAELARIKTQVVANEIYQRDSIFAQAMQIGTLETVGLDWRLMDSYVEKITAVTAEQVQQVARKYLIDDRLTVAVLEPLPIDPNKPRAAAAGAGGHNVR